MTYRKYLGPSEIPVILGCPYSTPAELREKLENPTVFKSTPKIRMGMKLEKDMLQKYSSTINSKSKLNIKFKSHDRLGGRADGIYDDGQVIRGVEIKCQFVTSDDNNDDPVIYDSYVQQSVAYMFLYQLEHWDVFCVRVNTDTKKSKILLKRLKWKDYEQTWRTNWYPKIKAFTDNVNWKK